ncbi:MAG: DUF768 domain-containing protein [Bauldia sp.]|nr:DUF768 domain-containing protein [Bauldia sp.]
MSKRFMRFAEDWIADNVRPPLNPDLEDATSRNERITRALLDLAALSGFAQKEIEEDCHRLLPLIETATATRRDPDLDRFRAGDD